MFSEEFYEQIVGKQPEKAMAALQTVIDLKSISQEKAQILANLLIPHWKSIQSILPPPGQPGLPAAPGVAAENEVP